MPTTNSTLPNRGRRVGVAAVAVAFFALFASPPAPAAGLRHWSVSLDGSYFWPTQAAVRQVYGASRIPVTLRLGYRTDFGLGIYAGCRYLRCRGETQTVGTVFAEERFTTILTLFGPQGGLFFTASLKRLEFLVNAGVSYIFFRETWQDAPLEASGEKWGFQADASAVYLLADWIGLQLRLGYNLVPTRQGAALAEDIDLGGLEAGIGFAIRF